MCARHAAPRSQVLQANLELPRSALCGEGRDYLLAATLLERFTSKQELRWVVQGVLRTVTGWQSRGAGVCLLLGTHTLLGGGPASDLADRSVRPAPRLCQLGLAAAHA